MQIILDTDKESKEALKKLAKFLKDLAGDEEENRNKFEPVASEGLFNMFQSNSENTHSENRENKENVEYEPFYEEEPKTDKKDKKDEPKIQIIDW